MHPILRARADQQLGLFTAVDAREAGYEHAEVRRLCRSGTWVRLRRGIYTTPDALDRARSASARHRIDCLAVVLELGRPTTVASHASAARLHGLPLRRDIAGTVRLTDADVWRRGRGFLLKQAPLRIGEIQRSGPLRVTSAARTLIDCAREWGLDDSVVAMDAALLSRKLTGGELRSAAAAARSWPGGLNAVRAVSLADGRAESPLETRGRLRILGAGLPTPELQVEIRTGGRLVAVVDAWFEEAAVAVEFDGQVKYTDPWRGQSPERALWEEKRREDELRGLDIRVVRIADADLGPPWARLETRLRELVSTAGPTRRRFSATARDLGRRRAG
ncbi:putative AbiEi antitoxin of type IV toxin-antitoxin system [Blastococcus colisei]|uniref:Putative AbiEi antitoxin of type IV toxin-antitoxin system n=1 Tax=Blastococcus colisei TaxID=1564162 RepID=A0A543PAG1_9ACTN|nr:type IV toxin-antitoxin system AbiEi family antitoxin domain-containing protein [Blastococcus colisei]TQN41062.1 putative AbiEi antitoxin of type IV toxin-antitoxin system [Blastococcus colisei]